MSEPGLPEDEAQLGVETFSQFGGKKRKSSKKHSKKSGKKTGKKVVKKSKKKIKGKKTRKSVGKKKLGKRKTLRGGGGYLTSMFGVAAGNGKGDSGNAGRSPPLPQKRKPRPLFPIGSRMTYKPNNDNRTKDKFRQIRKSMGDSDSDSDDE